MSWASKRKTIYFTFFASLFLLIASIFYYLFIYEAPTCFDGVQNQNEQDVDCGGPCEKVCDFQAIDPIVLWTKFFEVKEGIYNVFALIENPNLKTEALDVPYSFKLYDEKGVLIAEREGTIDLRQRSVTPVFERTIITDKRIPSRSPSFKFTSDIEWIKTQKDETKLSVQKKVLSEKDGNTRLNVEIKNNNIETIKNIEVTAILDNKEGNTIAVSQTSIDSLSKNDSESVFFTWPGEFKKEVTQIEVITIDKK